MVAGSSKYFISSAISSLGLVSLMMMPFSYLSVLWSVPIYFIVVFQFKSFQLIPSGSFDTTPFILKDNLRDILVVMFFLMTYCIFCSIISMGTILRDSSVTILEIYKRSFFQIISLSISFIQVIAGVFLAFKINGKRINKILNIIYFLTISICLYQLLASTFNLPYIGNYVNDIVFGVRYSALAVEPKFLSTYLLLMIFYKGSEFKAHLKNFYRFSSLLFFAVFFLGIYFFLKSGSANGYISLLLLLFNGFLLIPARIKGIFIIVLLPLFLFFFSILDVNSLGLRPVHLDIIENLSNINIFMFDDLIYLPLLSWGDYPWSFFFGFGPGLMHFSALEHLSQSTWITGTDTYIEGGLSIIMYISNFGLIVFLCLFFSIYLKGTRNVLEVDNLEDKGLNLFFLNSFIIGSIITGNISNPFFLAIGWILGKRYLRNFASK